MRTLVVANQKGGVGKTSTLVHLAFDFLERGLKVVVIDLDTQANASYTLQPFRSGLVASELFADVPSDSWPQTAIDFTDPDDAVFGRVFLNEIKKPISGAPVVDFTFRTPPLELRSTRNLPPGENVSYVTFVLFKRHWTPIGKAQGNLFTLISFRNYLHYHIKCCKSFLHTRMRFQVENLLKILNRAKQDGPKEKKTITGRSFTRQ